MGASASSAVASTDRTVDRWGVEEGLRNNALTAVLPDVRDAVVRQRDGTTFRMYQRDEVTLVFWQEGSVTCVLVSDIDSDEVLQLAFAKAEKV